MSCFSASASSRSISLTPMMALSGVRSSWLILARNCDLCWLASASWRLLSWISSNSRTFSIAITAWSAKVVTSSICLVVNGRTVAPRQRDHADRSYPLAAAARQAWCDKPAKSYKLQSWCIPDRPEHPECGLTLPSSGSSSGRPMPRPIANGMLLRSTLRIRASGRD